MLLAVGSLGEKQLPSARIDVDALTVLLRSATDDGETRVRMLGRQDFFRSKETVMTGAEDKNKQSDCISSGGKQEWYLSVDLLLFYFHSTQELLLLSFYILPGQVFPNDAPLSLPQLQRRGSFP